MAKLTKESAQQAAAKATAEAQAFLAHQRVVLDQAATAVRQAGRTVAKFANDEVAPRARDAWEHTRPVLERGVATSRDALHRGAVVSRDVAHKANEKLQKDVLPAVANAVGTAMTVVELARSEVVRDAIRKAGTTGKAAVSAGSKAAVKAAKSGSGGGGRAVLIGLGLVVLGSAAYAAWRVFRAEDDLWAPEADATPEDV